MMRAVIIYYYAKVEAKMLGWIIATVIIAALLAAGAL